MFKQQLGIKEDSEKKKFYFSLFYPAILVIILWVVKIIENTLKIDFANFGIYPLRSEGLLGIITAPLVHSNYKHLINNSIPLFFLSTAIFYFYKEVALKVILFTWLLTGIWVWFGARASYHIGASGLVYGYASFLFFSGIIRRNINLLAISLLVTFLYGGMVWGIFPFKSGISWESHLWGVIAGLVMAIFYKDYGPQLKKYEWEDAEDADEENEDFESNSSENIEIKYIYKKREGHS